MWQLSDILNTHACQGWDTRVIREGQRTPAAGTTAAQGFSPAASPIPKTTDNDDVSTVVNRAEVAHDLKFFRNTASRETMRVASVRALRARRGGGRPPVKLDNVRILYEGEVIRKYIQFRSISCEEFTHKPKDATPCCHERFEWWMRRQTSQGAWIAPRTILFAGIAPFRLDHLQNPPNLPAFSPWLLCKTKLPRNEIGHCCALTRHQLPTSHSHSPRLLHAALKKKLREELNILPKTSIFVEFRFGDDEDWTEVPRPRTVSSDCGLSLPKAPSTG
jgi:hypothetical protein